MTPDLCPHCGQALPRGDGYLTPRELDVLVAWWMEGSVRKAAIKEGITEQRAKNLLSAARIRNGVHSTDKLLALHLQAVGRRPAPAVEADPPLHVCFGNPHGLLATSLREDDQVGHVCFDRPHSLLRGSVAR